MYVWLNDRVIDAADARISVYDRGFRTGEGIFETLRAYRGHPFRLSAHLDRAGSGGRSLGFSLPDRALLSEAVLATARANDPDEDQVLRLTVTPGAIDPASPFPGRAVGAPTVVVTAQPLHVPEGTYERGVTAVTLARSRELPEVKSVSYLSASLARREAQRRGAEEALLVTPEELLLEGSYSNIFLVNPGVLVTPALELGILPGVTRAVVLELAREAGLSVQQREVHRDELSAHEEAFLTATTREIVPLVEVDGAAIADGRPGPVTAELLRRYRAEVDREIAAAR